MLDLGLNSSANNTLDRDENVALIEVSVSATILCLAIVGNVCVLISLANRRKRLSRMHLMILHLSLADLFVAFFNVLPQLAWDITYRFEGGQFLCVAVKYCQVVAMYASSYVLLATAIDRSV
ncbi:annetocin receptor [Elysia marginata]|uniref:Annetocin receptor n=1 Tax=Elysia marginata TaxID=1093978 RepID=A0AAV4ILR9_9GAST|nr:annetocin receptor [Elysia marginata]